MNASFTIATLPAVTCAPWCQDGAGHVTADHPDDQVCMSDGLRVELTAMPLITFEGEVEGRDFVEAYLVREGHSTWTTLQVSHYERTAWTFTPAEAKTFAQELLRLVEAAETGTA